MLPDKSSNTNSFKAAADDLVSTIQTAIQQDELSASDRASLMSELDVLIESLKQTKTKLAAKRKRKAA
ncbi:MAG: hypothetical protein GC192_22555 [Bacteroidetes bacterium]|nr:hypothetical protein [Bacteroidota bacterium]